MHEAAGVAGHVRTGAPGQPDLGPGAIEGVARPFVGPPGHRLRAAATGRHVQRRRERQLHAVGPPLQPERCRRSDVESHRVVDTAAHRHQRDDAIDRAPAAGRSDERLRTRRVDGADPHTAAGLDAHLHRPTGESVTRRALHGDPCPRRHHEGSDDTDDKGTEDEVAEHLHPPGARIVGHQPPQADDQRARHHRRPRSGRSRPAAHGRGAGVVSRSSRITAAECVASPSSSTVRMRCARQSTATAFTSSGTT